MIKRIKVTAEHITKGRRLNANFCPTALALKDAGFSLVTVTSDFVRGVFRRKFLGLTIWKYYVSTTPTEEMRDFIYHFDGGGSVAPFEFDLVIS